MADHFIVRIILCGYRCPSPHPLPQPDQSGIAAGQRPRREKRNLKRVSSIARTLIGSTTDKHKEKKQMAMAERRNIEFGVEGGVTLRGWLFVPGAKGPAPAITMADGYAGVKEHGLERFARAFAEAGL